MKKKIIFFATFILITSISLNISAITSEAPKASVKNKNSAKGKDLQENIEDSKPIKKVYLDGEPLFYLDGNRRPTTEPFKVVNDDEYFLCRGTVSQWYRRQITEEFNTLSEKDGLTQITGKNCALKLTRTKSERKLPIVTVEMFPTAGAMDHCILGGGCKSSRYVILYVKEKVLYRTFILNEPEMDIYREYCLNNKSEILSESTCWNHLNTATSKVPAIKNAD